MTFRLEHLHIKTRDPEKTARFYMDTLGATLIEVSRDNTHFRINLHGLTMNITDHVEYQKRQQKYGLEHLAVETDDMDGTLATLKSQGAVVLEELISPVPHHKGGRICFLEGPEGIQLELVEIIK
jgi:catechol 2,3-dioxygenase-like lactoylglutathione lyase family enzyme